jgi:hypothetical protein
MIQILSHGTIVSNLNTLLVPSTFWNLRLLSQNLKPLVDESFGETLSLPIWWSVAGCRQGLLAVLASLTCDVLDLRFACWISPGDIISAMRVIRCKCLTLSMYTSDQRGEARGLIRTVVALSSNKEWLSLKVISTQYNVSTSEVLAAILETSAPKCMRLITTGAPLTSWTSKPTGSFQPFSNTEFDLFELVVSGVSFPTSQGRLGIVMSSIRTAAFSLVLDGEWDYVTHVGDIAFPKGISRLQVELVSFSSTLSCTEAISNAFRGIKRGSLTTLSVSVNSDCSSQCSSLVKEAVLCESRSLQLDVQMRGVSLHGLEPHKGFLSLTITVKTQEDVNAISRFCSHATRLSLHVKVLGCNLFHLDLPSVDILELIIETFPPGGARQDLGSLVPLKPRSIGHLSLTVMAAGFGNRTVGLAGLLKTAQLSVFNEYSLTLLDVEDQYNLNSEGMRHAFSHATPACRRVYTELPCGGNSTALEDSFNASPLL